MKKYEIMDTLADTIASLVYQEYIHYLPMTKAMKEKEWTVLSGFLLGISNNDTIKWELVSLGTGTRCLNKKQLHEDDHFYHRVHDSHAEIIARRGLLM